MMTNEPVSPPGLCNEKQAAAWLGVSPRTVWALRAAGRLPCVRIGRAVRYRVEDLSAFALANCRSRGASAGLANEEGGRR